MSIWILLLNLLAVGGLAALLFWLVAKIGDDRIRKVLWAIIAILCCMYLIGMFLGEISPVVHW